MRLALPLLAIWVITSLAQAAPNSQGTVANASGYHFQDYVLTADLITYDRLTKTLQGTGHARLITPNGNTILGAQITIPDCENKPLKRIIVAGLSKVLMAA